MCIRNKKCVLREESFFEFILKTATYKQDIVKWQIVWKPILVQHSAHLEVFAHYIKTCLERIFNLLNYCFFFLFCCGKLFSFFLFQGDLDSCCRWGWLSITYSLFPSTVPHFHNNVPVTARLPQRRSRWGAGEEQVRICQNRWISSMHQIMFTKHAVLLRDVTQSCRCFSAVKHSLPVTVLLETAQHSLMSPARTTEMTRKLLLYCSVNV